MYFHLYRPDLNSNQFLTWMQKKKKGKKSDHGIFLVVKGPITNFLNTYLLKLFWIKTVQLKYLLPFCSTSEKRLSANVVISDFGDACAFEVSVLVSLNYFVPLLITCFQNICFIHWRLLLHHHVLSFQSRYGSVAKILTLDHSHKLIIFVVIFLTVLK